LALGLRRGEVLGLTWNDVSLDTAQVAITWQLQRARGELRHRETKTPGSEANHDPHRPKKNPAPG
jgi:integrase